MITVKIPALNEDWHMPVKLKHSLYKYLFQDCAKISPSIYEEWYNTLSEENKAKIQKIKPATPPLLWLRS